ncbi:MAG: hypothetical protein IID33_10785 [Planctomycetes bacterium]|nr:hypothetical protein [Planctomycetota bacterium]
MVTRLGAMGLTALLAACALAQTAEPAEPNIKKTPSASENYWVRIRGKQVNIRSRPDRNSVVVARADDGQVLRVVGRDFGWLRVVPPSEVFSLVSAAHVTVGPDGRGVVAVERGKLRVRVGSSMRKLDPTRSEVQTLLPRDAVVQVRENLGEWLKIDPPDGVFVYVSAEFSERISQSDARQWLSDRAAVMNPPAASQPSAVVLASDEKRINERSQEVDLSGRWGRRLSAIEGRIKASGEKPILDQKWNDIVAELEPIAVQRGELEVSRLAAAWIARLEERLAHQELLRQARTISRRQTRARDQHEREMAGIAQARERALRRPEYAARGELAASFAFDQKTHPRRYRLLDPLTRRIEAYVEFPSDFKSDPKKLVGTLIGVRGTRRHAPGLGVDLIDVTGVVPLKPKPAATRKTP